MGRNSNNVVVSLRHSGNVFKKYHQQGLRLFWRQSSARRNKSNVSFGAQQSDCSFSPGVCRSKRCRSRWQHALLCFFQTRGQQGVVSFFAKTRAAATSTKNKQRRPTSVCGNHRVRKIETVANAVFSRSSHFFGQHAPPLQSRGQLGVGFGNRHNPRSCRTEQTAFFQCPKTFVFWWWQKQQQHSSSSSSISSSSSSSTWNV